MKVSKGTFASYNSRLSIGDIGRFLGGAQPYPWRRPGSYECAATTLTLSVTFGVIPCSFFHSFSWSRQQSTSSPIIDPTTRISSSENKKKEMMWVSASVRGNDTGDALQTCITEIKQKRKGKSRQLATTPQSTKQQQPKERNGDRGEEEDAVDLCIVHFSDEHLWQLDLVKDVLLQIFEPKVLIGTLRSSLHFIQSFVTPCSSLYNR